MLAERGLEPERFIVVQKPYMELFELAPKLSFSSGEIERQRNAIEQVPFVDPSALFDQLNAVADISKLAV